LQFAKIGNGARSVVRERYRRMVTEVYEAYLASPQVTIEKRGESSETGLYVKPSKAGTILDITDVQVRSGEDTAAIIKHWNDEGYVLDGYVIVRGSNDRYLIFVRREIA
jgi:hypothetical protein